MLPLIISRLAVPTIRYSFPDLIRRGAWTSLKSAILSPKGKMIMLLAVPGIAIEAIEEVVEEVIEFFEDESKVAGSDSSASVLKQDMEATLNQTRSFVETEAYSDQQRQKKVVEAIGRVKDGKDQFIDFVVDTINRGTILSLPSTQGNRFVLSVVYKLMEAVEGDTVDGSLTADFITAYGQMPHPEFRRLLALSIDIAGTIKDRLEQLSKTTIYTPVLYPALASDATLSVKPKRDGSGAVRGF